MLADDVLHANVSRDVKISVEARSNAFNLKCLSVLCGFTLLSVICNYIGIFSVDHMTMRIAVTVALTTFFVPITTWFLHDRLFKRSPSVLSWDGFKFLILFSIYFGIAVTCITLTFHAILLMVLPGIFAAQYPDQRRLLKWVVLGSLVLVPAGVYVRMNAGISATAVSLQGRRPVCREAIIYGSGC